MKFHGALAANVEVAGPAKAGEPLRVRAIVNSNRIMSSGRLLHPAAYQKWLADNPKATLPMYANHGWARNETVFSTIGEWDRFGYDEQLGMVWSGWVGEGTGLQADARKLLGQKLLKQLSLDWEGEAKVAYADEPDLDPYVKAQLEAAGVERAIVFYDWRPFGASVVDAADDTNARMVAAADEMAALQNEFIALRHDVQQLRQAAGGVSRADLDATFDAFVERFRSEAIEVLLSDPEIEQAGKDLAELMSARNIADDMNAGGNNTPSTGDSEMDCLLGRVREIGR